MKRILPAAVVIIALVVLAVVLLTYERDLLWKVQEMNRLEQEEKSLYGFDLSNYIQNKDIQDAESAWITPESISNLVDSFLTDFLGDGEYIRITLY